MSINLKAFHRESNLLFNKVDITVPTLENNIYSRQKCEIKPQIKEWKAVGKNLQDIKKKSWKNWEKCWFHWFVASTTNQTHFIFLSLLHASKNNSNNNVIFSLQAKTDQCSFTSYWLNHLSGHGLTLTDVSRSGSKCSTCSQTYVHEEQQRPSELNRPPPCSHMLSFSWWSSHNLVTPSKYTTAAANSI